MISVRLLKISALAAISFLFIGCSAHFRGALRDYRKNEPASFARRTLDWTKQSPQAAPVIAGLPKIADAATSNPQTVAMEIAAEILGENARAVESKIDFFRNSENLTDRFKNNISWDDLKFAIVARNPSLRAAEQEFFAMNEQFSQADFLEALLAQFRTFTRNLDVQAGQPSGGTMSREFFPYPGTIALKGEMIRSEVRIARLQWERSLRDVLVEAGELLIQLDYLNDAKGTAGENVEIATNLANVTEERYRTGDAPQTDLIRTQTELERRRNELADLIVMQRTAEAKLNALLDRPAEAPLGPPRNVGFSGTSFSLDELTSRGLQSRQEVAMQRARIDRSKAAIRMGEVMNRPAAGGGYSRLERGMMAESSPGMPMDSFGAQAKLQVEPGFAQAEAFLAEMRRRLAADEAMLDQMEAETRAMASETLNEIDTARREVRLLENVIVPQYRSAYETTTSRYVSGSAAFADLFETERMLIEARLEADAARRDLNLAHLRLIRVLGMFL